MMQSSMKVVLAGYYGFGNAGDELILQAIIDYLKKVGFPLANLTVLSKNPFCTSSQYGVKSVNRWSAFALTQAIAGCDLFILGGGGLLQDSTGKFGLWYYLLLLWLAIFCKKRVMVLAVGIGPLQWGVNRRFTAFTLSHVHFLSVRDADSLSQLREMGLPEKDLRLGDEIPLVADPVFALKLDRDREKRGGNDNRKVRIGLVIRRVSHTPTVDDQEKMVKMLAEFTRKISQQLGCEICLLPFHPAMDRSAIQSFLKELNENVRIGSDGKREELPSVSCLEWSTLDELIQLFSEMELVVSFRYHAVVLAVMMGIPVMGISADAKISHLMQSFFGAREMKNWILSEECNSERVLGVALELWENRQRFQEVVNENLPRYRESALAGLKSIFSA